MRNLFIVFFILWNIVMYSQEDAWVYFTNKPNAQYHLENPLTMLSQQAIDRRARQHIAIDELDVPIHQEYISELQAVNGILIMAQSKWMNTVHVRGNPAIIDQLSALDFVARIEFANRSLNHSSRIQLPVAAREKFETLENFQYGYASRQIEMLQGDKLHRQNYTGTGKVIAVLDNGFVGVNIAAPFQRLIQNNQILGGYDFVNRRSYFYGGGDHGTMVLSTMGAFEPEGLVGTAPDAQYYLFITEATAYENPVEESYWVEAAEVADSLGVDVINTSLGYFQFDNPAYNYVFADMNGQKSFISRGADIAYSRGMICVTSAGNSGNTSNPNIAVPADSQYTLTVGAVDATGTYAPFSSIGPTADNRLKPDIVAQGVTAVVATPSGALGGANGTSFSSPIVAGLVACLWQALPEATNAQIIQWVKESAHLYSNPNYQLGNGIPDFYQAYQSGLLTTNEPEIKSVILYPNPFDKELYCLGLDSTTIVEWYSLQGQKMMTSVIHNNNFITVPHLASGIYIYKIITEQQIYTGKIIKK